MANGASPNDELPTSPVIPGATLPPPIDDALFAEVLAPKVKLPTGSASPSQQTKIPKELLDEVKRALKPRGISVRSASETKVDGHFGLSTLKGIVEAMDRYPYDRDDSSNPVVQSGLATFRDPEIRSLLVPMVNATGISIKKDHILAARVNSDDRFSSDVGNLVVGLDHVFQTLGWKADSMLIVPLPDQLFEQVQRFAFNAHERGKYLQVVDPTRNPQLLALDLIQLMIDMPGSDLHLDFSPDGELIPRIRKDGKLQPIRVTGGSQITLDEETGIHLVSQFMLLGKLNIADKQLLQDGVIPLGQVGFFEEHHQVFGKADPTMLEELRSYSLRVAFVPTETGSSLTLRLLNTRSAEEETLDSARLSPHIVTQLREVMSLPQGLVAISGPTGSGKSTTLYKMLTELNTGDVSIATVEDPVERLIPGARQMQIGQGRTKDKRVATFPDCLRSIVRMDPDIILIGETRDFETANIAIQSSATGHLVFTTTHANDAPKTLDRLRSFREGEAEIDEAGLYSTIQLTFAQRLPRRTCDNCAGEASAEEQFKVLEDLSGIELPTEGLMLPIATGSIGGSECPTCYGEGYDGRLPLCEYLRIDEDVIEKLSSGASSKAIARFAIENGNYKPFAWDAFRLILSGQTDINEVTRKIALKTLVDEAETLKQMLVLLSDEETIANAVKKRFPSYGFADLSQRDRSLVVSNLLSDFIEQWRGAKRTG